MIGAVRLDLFLFVCNRLVRGPGVQACGQVCLRSDTKSICAICQSTWLGRFLVLNSLFHARLEKQALTLCWITHCWLFGTLPGEAG